MFNRIFRSRETSQIDLLVKEYHHRLTSGECVNRGTFVAQYPDIAGKLHKALLSDPQIIEAERTLSHAGKMAISEAKVVDIDGEISSGLEIPDVLKLASTIDNFEIINEIGRGAMGRVYRARDTVSNTIVALKTLQPGLSINTSQLQRMSREGMAQGTLKHSNIIEVYKYGEFDDGIPYIAMEYVEGGRSIESLIAESQKTGIDIRQSAKIILDVAHALAYSHRQRVFHRDIKPANIMLAGNTPKLTDFGLALAENLEVTRLTQSGELLGTLVYMAPELVGGFDREKGVALSPQSDIYALGTTLFEMVTGTIPFLAESPGALIKKIIDDDVPDPKMINTAVDKNIEAICIKCLEKKPSDRYYSAAELADDLQRYLDGVQPQAPRINWVLRRARRSLRGRKTILLVSVIAIMAAVLAAAISQRFNHQKKLTVLNDTRGAPPSPDTDFDLNFLIAAASQKDADTKINAITALFRHSGDRGDAALLAAATDENPKIRLHLISSLYKTRHNVAKSVCKILLKDRENFVVSGAVQVAEKLQFREFVPQIKMLSLKSNKILRNYSLHALHSLTGDEFGSLIRFYLENASDDLKLEFLNRFIDLKLPPDIPEFIAFLNRELSPELAEKTGAVLNTFTDVDFQVNHDKWDQWWQLNAHNWQLHRCATVTWAGPGETLQAGDIIWRINGDEIRLDYKQSLSDDTHVEIIRNNKLLKYIGVQNHKSYTFYVGIRNGMPVGNNDFVRQIRDVFSVN